MLCCLFNALDLMVLLSGTKCQVVSQCVPHVGKVSSSTMSFVLLLLFLLFQCTVSRDLVLKKQGRLFSFEDTFSRAEVGAYYLSIVVALAMAVPIFYLTPGGRGRALPSISAADLTKYNRSSS